MNADQVYVRSRQPISRSRRQITFHSLDDILPDVRRLAPAHHTLGQWTLGQICWHLAVTVDASIDGMNLRNHRRKRRLIGLLLFRYTLRFGIPPNYTVDTALTPPSHVALSAAMMDLERSLLRYRQHTGPLRPHALFGRLSRSGWDRMHLLHAAHHLSFVIPANTRGEG